MKANTRTTFKTACKLYKDGKINNYNKLYVLLTLYIKNQHIPSSIGSRSHKRNEINMSPTMINIAVQ